MNSSVREWRDHSCHEDGRMMCVNVADGAARDGLMERERERDKEGRARKCVCVQRAICVVIQTD